MRSLGIETRIFPLYGANGSPETYTSSPVIPLRMWHAVRIDPLGLLRMRAALVGWQPDILHCHDYYAAFAALMLRYSGVHIPIVDTVHLDLFRGHQRSGLLIQWTLQHCDLVTAVSQHTAATVESFTCGLVNPLIIPNGIRLDRMKAPSGFSREAKRAALGCEADSLVLITVAALTNVKDHQTLLRAFAGALSNLGNARLVVVGDGPLRKEMEKLALDLGIARQVMFLGRRVDVPELLRAADIFVLSTHNEGFPISVIEACWLGIPAVATEVGGLADLRAAHLGVLLTQARNVNSLRDALISLADSGKRQLLGHQLREQARSLFDIKRTVNDYSSVYEELLARDRRY